MSIVSSPTFRSSRSRCRTNTSASRSPFRPNTSGRRSTRSFFHWLTCTGCTWCSRAISLIVLSPLTASSATRALNSALCCLRLPISSSFPCPPKTAYHNFPPGFKSGVRRSSPGLSSVDEAQAGHPKGSFHGLLPASSFRWRCLVLPFILAVRLSRTAGGMETDRGAEVSTESDRRMVATD